MVIGRYFWNVSTYTFCIYLLSVSSDTMHFRNVTIKIFIQARYRIADSKTSSPPHHPQVFHPSSLKWIKPKRFFGQHFWTSHTFRLGRSQYTLIKFSSSPRFVPFSTASSGSHNCCHSFIRNRLLRHSAAHIILGLCIWTEPSIFDRHVPISICRFLFVLPSTSSAHVVIHG